MDSKAKAPSVAQRSDHDIKKSNIEIPYSALNATDIKPTYEDLYQTVQNSKAERLRIEKEQEERLNLLEKQFTNKLQIKNSLQSNETTASKVVANEYSSLTDKNETDL